jgi:SRP54-type protein, GTPase domain.
VSGEVHVSIVGLPSSGKTTLLAALWHMVREPGSSTALSFDGLSNGNYEHLNQLAKRWRSGKIQQRTQVSGARNVTMRLKDASGRQVEVSFPDLPGEEFARMWERRELDKSMVGTLAAPAIVLLINGDTIRMPAWVVERMALAKKLGVVPAAIEAAEWSADLAPTQVKVVDLLQMLMSGDLNIGSRRLSLLISAWDKVEGEQLTPAGLLESKLPLLDQYLRSGRDPWTWHVWGLSAQGGVYEDPEKEESFDETERLRELERPSDRIKVVDGDAVTTDITKPLEWLIG